MSKRISMIACFVIVSILFVTTDASAQNFSDLDKSPADIATYPKRGAEKVIKVIYSRPKANNRTVFGELVKYDKVWRTGANEGTEITFYQDVTIGGKEVKAGTYTVFTIPKEGKWTFILNADLNQWGAYQYKDNQNVIQVEVNSKKIEKAIEVFSITVEKSKAGATMYLGWENTIVEIPIEF